jgi:GH25 family lysozyme M1 (1,4-beta-N-acetylmuramidase)
MTKICPNCGGGLANCPVCNAPPKRVLPKLTVYDRMYSTLFGAAYWEVQGIDLSKWNGQVNFSIAKTKCQYVIMRGGYGQWKDGAVDSFYQNARAQDMPVGLYWYLNMEQDPNLTAQSFAEEIATHPPQVEIVLDAESTVLDATGTLNWLKQVDTRLTNLTGKKAMIYTSAGFWNSKVARSSYWAGRILWVANWTTRDTPTMPYDWSSWTHWQWSANGNKKAVEYGSTGGDLDMDLNRFNGTCTQFNSKYGTHIKPIGEVTPPPPPGTLPEYVIITTGELAIHNTPQAIQTNIVGHALLNTRWYPYEEMTANGITWYVVGKNLYISKNYTKLP